MKHFSILLLCFFAVLLMSATCKSTGDTGNGGPDSTAVVVDTTTLPTGGIKPPRPNPAEVEQKLYAQYMSGEIEKCLFEGVTVYKCSRNAPDAGSEIYANNGDRQGRCYYSTGQVDPICEKLTDCKTIYRVAKNIWGKPEVKWSGLD